MNMNQIVNMVIRIIMRKAINSGISAGIGAFANKGGQGQKPGKNGSAPQREVQETAVRTRKMTRTAQRITRL